MAKTFIRELDPIDIHELLEHRHEIAIIWATEDVQCVRPDLDINQSWKVLKACKRRHDCEQGLTWEFIAYMADALFPQKQVE